jgi:hypothetical protein
VSPLSLLTFFAAAKKVSAAPHRGEANRPKTKQGKANTAGTATNQGAAGNKPNNTTKTKQTKTTKKPPDKSQRSSNFFGKKHAPNFTKRPIAIQNEGLHCRPMAKFG